MVHRKSLAVQIGRINVCKELIILMIGASCPRDYNMYNRTIFQLYENQYLKIVTNLQTILSTLHTSHRILNDQISGIIRITYYLTL